MSNHLISVAYKRDLRTSMRKAVLVLMADKASDDGSGIWAAKQTMADELCCSKQTVIGTIKTLISEGLVSECGRRKNPNGYTVEYHLNVEALEALPLVKCHAGKGSTSLTGQPAGPVNEADVTGQPAGPKPSLTSLTPVVSNETTCPKIELTIDQLKEGWNDVAAANGAVECRCFGPERRRKAGTYIRRYSVEDITEAIHAVARSDFLCGRGKQFFRADIDFLFEAKHMNRLLEHFYDRQAA